MALALPHVRTGIVRNFGHGPKRFALFAGKKSDMASIFTVRGKMTWFMLCASKSRWKNRAMELGTLI
jgi:hypothetical protein